MPGLRTDEMPAEVAKIRDQVAKFTGVPADYEYLFVFDHTHEGLTPGSFQIALEGSYEWPFHFCEAVHEGKFEVPGHLFLEPGTGWWLGIYPD